VVSGEDEKKIALAPEKRQVLSYCVGRPLIPVSAFQCLLGRKNGDKIAGKIVETIGQKNMPVKGFAAELSQYKDPPHVRMNTVAQRKIYQSKTAGYGHCRLTSGHSQRHQTAALTACHYYGHNI